LRARIEGAVVRFPGTGDGVARLVEVSMVKVDMRAASSRRQSAPPVHLGYGSATMGTLRRAGASSRQVRGRTPRDLEQEFVMIDRQLIGDVVLAALVAIPAAALARPDLPQIRTAASSIPVEKSAVALAPAEERQVGIFR